MKKVKRHAAGVILLLIIGATAAFGTVQIAPGVTEEQNIPFDYFIDNEGSLSFKTIRNTKGFIRDKRKNFGFTSDSVWIRFTVEVEKPVEENWFVEINYPLLDRIEAYFPRKDGSYKKLILGDHLPFHSRPIAHQNFILPLPVHRGSHTCFLKVTSTSAITLPMVAVPGEVMVDNIIKTSTALGLVYGALLVMLLYNLVLALSLRNLAYLWYSAYIAGMIFLSMAMNGYGFQYLWPDTPRMNDATPFAIFSIAIWLGLFARSFLNLRKVSPLLNRIALAFIGFYCAGSAISWFLPYETAIIISAASLIPGVSFNFVCMIVGSVKKVKQTYHLIYAFLFLFVGALISVFHRFGFLPNNIITLWGFQGGAVFSVALLSIGLADRLNTLKNELFALNLGLEEKVTERTRELADANRDLEASQRIHEQDLRMAVNVQNAFFPGEAPFSDDYDIAFCFYPLSGVSGDFYDFYTEKDRLLGIGLFDVSGHGIASGLLTLIARSIIYRNFTSGKNNNLGDVMKIINGELIEEIGRVDNYLTGLLVRFTDEGLETVNCGHADPILIRQSDAQSAGTVKVTSRLSKGSFLGIEIMASDYQAASLELESGDMLFIYTDGLSEGINKEEEQFGEGRITEILEKHSGNDATQIIDELMNSYFEFIGGKENMEDDLTAICLIRK